MLVRRALLAALLAVLCAAPAHAAQWQPPKHLPWYWQLQGTVRTTVAADAYDIDVEDTPASTVAALHQQGRHVIAYFSAGTFENWRSDAARFPAAVKGRSVDGWAGERWLDIRRLDVLEPIMRDRIARAKAKGFDAVEPDNVDGYTNPTGFPLTGADQAAYNRLLAQLAHDQGLAVFLKNDVDQARLLEPSFDGSLVEECARYSECGQLAPFLAAGKPVLEAEYGRVRDRWAADANRAGRMLAFTNLALDGRRWLPAW